MTIECMTEVEDDRQGGEMTRRKCIFINHHRSFEAFQELIQRGINLWPDAPAEIKEFADLVTIGKVQQDYAGQAKRATLAQGGSDKPAKLEMYEWNYTCQCGVHNIFIDRAREVKENRCPECEFVTTFNPPMQRQE